MYHLVDPRMKGDWFIIMLLPLSQPFNCFSFDARLSHPPNIASVLGKMLRFRYFLNCRLLFGNTKISSLGS
jgi:hypothetical protein